MTADAEGPPRQGLDRLRNDELREALRLLTGEQAPQQRAGALRALREALRGYGTVRTAVERAPDAARDAFLRLVQDGPVPVAELLGRGWWGRGMLPPPLDWLQRRALVVVADDGRVAAVAEAREGFAELTLDLAPMPAPTGTVTVAAAASVVVVAAPAQLDRVVGVAEAGLRSIAPTVAVSDHEPAVVTAALRRAGVPLGDDVAVPTVVDAPALPTTAEDAVGPRAIRDVLTRAVEEGRQVHLRYFASSRGGTPTERVVDPWSFDDDLLRGWCHLRDGERTFAVDRVGRARLLPTTIDHPQGHTPRSSSST